MSEPDRQPQTIVVATPNGALEVVASEFDGDIVRGVGTWPGHATPIRFWTKATTWDRLRTSAGLLEAATPFLTPPSP